MAIHVVSDGLPLDWIDAHSDVLEILYGYFVQELRQHDLVVFHDLAPVLLPNEEAVHVRLTCEDKLGLSVERCLVRADHRVVLEHERVPIHLVAAEANHDGSFSHEVDFVHLILFEVEGCVSFFKPGLHLGDDVDEKRLVHVVSLWDCLTLVGLREEDPLFVDHKERTELGVKLTVHEPKDDLVLHIHRQLHHQVGVGLQGDVLAFLPLVLEVVFKALLEPYVQRLVAVQLAEALHEHD